MVRSPPAWTSRVQARILPSSVGQQLWEDGPEAIDPSKIGGWERMVVTSQMSVFPPQPEVYSRPFFTIMAGTNGEAVANQPLNKRVLLGAVTAKARIGGV